MSEEVSVSKRNRLRRFGVIAIIIIGCFGIFQYIQYKESPYNEVEREKNYNQAVRYANVGKWEDVGGCLVRYIEVGGKYAALYNYANAMKYYTDDRKGLHDMANYYLKDVPEDYSDEFSDDIIKLKKKLKDEEDRERETREFRYKLEHEIDHELDEIASRHVFVGDIESKIERVYGEPETVNKHTSQYGVSKQYVYRRGDKTMYIYTEDGIVTDIQE